MSNASRETRTWLVTGCSTGLGRALAGRIVASGDRCVATARDPASLADLARDFPDAFLALALDVRDAGQRE
jgi:NADP-dependent 3-hydroxy acid dehydrogenase YdfG